jgi:hypothetical protein
MSAFLAEKLDIFLPRVSISSWTIIEGVDRASKQQMNLTKIHFTGGEPQDAHVRCSDKVAVVTTSLPRLKAHRNVQFETRDSLIHALVTSCDLPIWSGWRSDAVIKRHFDGGMSEFCPSFLEPSDTANEVIIRISPLHGNFEICPAMWGNKIAEGTFVNGIRIGSPNLARMKQSLTPLTEAAVRTEFENGKRDCEEWLDRIRANAQLFAAA